MSRERELLYRWYRGARDQVDFGELYDKTEELLTQPEQTAVDNAVYTVSWHEKKHRDDNWEVRRHIVSNPELIKMFLTFNKQLSELIFGKNIIWGLQMQEGEPTKEYDLKLCKTKEVMDYLAQPEQEPVAWVWEVFNPHTGDWCDGCVAKDKPLENQNRRNIRALYTAPPRREPLTGREISHGFRLNPDATHAESYWAGVEWAEKAHGIGGGE